jgi:hypothetical protein
MKIILQGGPYHGKHEAVSEATRQISMDEEWIYKIEDEAFLEGLQVFKFDKKASRVHRRKLEPLL